MRDHLTRKQFVKRAVKRFMPGESQEEAIAAAQSFSIHKIPVIFTYLGENTTDSNDALKVTNHYCDLLKKISSAELQSDISVKLTQLGLDLSYEMAIKNFATIAESANINDLTVWIDMESSAYTDPTLKFYQQVRKIHQNVGICLQAYLKRTHLDVQKLISIYPRIRLVKGAYMESGEIAFKTKADVDKNYMMLSNLLLQSVYDKQCKVAFATHDHNIIDFILEISDRIGLSDESISVQMLYGIQAEYQKYLSRKGKAVSILISYGEEWFPWYMRRLAERPANIWFVVKNLF